MHDIELAVDMSEVEQFLEWIKDTLPGISVRIGKSTECKINGIPIKYSTYKDDLTALWEEYCGQ